MSKVLKTSILFLAIIFAQSCNKDDTNQDNAINFTVEDLVIEIIESAPFDTLLGVFSISENAENLSFIIQSQTPVGAFRVDAATGELFVENSSKFNYESNPQITAVVKVVGNGHETNANVTINLIDYKEEDLHFLGIGGGIGEGPNSYFDIERNNDVVTRTDFYRTYEDVQNNIYSYNNSNRIDHHYYATTDSSAGCSITSSFLFDADDTLTNIHIVRGIKCTGEDNFSVSQSGNVLTIINTETNSISVAILDDQNRIISLEQDESSVTLVYENELLSRIDIYNNEIFSFSKNYYYDDFRNPFYDAGFSEVVKMEVYRNALSINRLIGFENKFSNPNNIIRIEWSGAISEIKEFIYTYNKDDYIENEIYDPEGEFSHGYNYE